MGRAGRDWHGDPQGGQSSSPGPASRRTSVPRASPFSAQSERDISWHDGVVLSQLLAGGGVPGRESGQVTHGMLLLPMGVSPAPARGAQGCAWGVVVVAQEERAVKPLGLGQQMHCRD